jgi:HflK protein
MLEDRQENSSLLSEFGAEYGYAAIIGVLLILNVTGTFKYIFGLDTAIVLTLMAGYKTFYNSISALLEKTISADLALCVAVIAALSVGEYVAAAEAMFIVMVGETIESYAAGRTEAAIRRFVAQLPRIARLLLADGSEKEVDAATLTAGDRIVVRAGERIAADGIIDLGVSSIDQSSITGEPLPADKQSGDEVFSGTLNGNGLLHIRVTRAGEETTLARVIHLVEEAKEQRAPVERLADRYAKYFLPALLLSAALTYYFTGNWLRTVAVLIVACPCALILATPTAMVAAIGGLARRGILVRGGAVLQRAAKVDTAVFDKTGTLTEGRFEIAKIVAMSGDENGLIALAAAAERGSDHALARVIVEESERRGLLVPHPETARVLPGRGVEATLNGRTIRAGNAQYMAEIGIGATDAVIAEADRLGATAVLIADGDRLAGAILLRDRIRDGASEAVSALPGVGVTSQVMLTGDRRRAAEVIAREIGIHSVEAELLPEQKLDRVRHLAAQGRTVAMLGDGINDAAALAASSVGIAVSGASDITAEAADVVYMPHSLERLPRLFEVSQRAMRTAWLNIVLFAGALNALAVLACATGKLGPIGAAFTHQLSSFFVMMNSLRLLRVERSEVSRGRLAGWCVACAGRFTGQFREWVAASPLAEAWNGLRRFDPEQAFRRVTARRRELVKPALITVAALIALSGIYAVQPDEVGVIERFGRKVTPFSDPGLHYKLPWPIDRLTRVQAHRVRVVEIGFRSNSGTIASAEPAAYEWNVQHRTGRFESRPDESLMFTGDQNMIELNASIHYDVEHPDAFLFRQIDAATAVRAAGESTIHGIVGSTSLDEVLTTGRQAIEARALAELQRRMDRYETGVRVLRVKLLDVHPSIEVVDAFRGVSAAFEEKNRMVNEAEGYRNEQVALARGNAKAQVQNANSYTLGRINRSEGDATRFTQQEQAYRTAPGPTETRLYLETMEQVLTGKKKLILDSGKGRRHLLLLEDGVEIAPPGTGILGTRP